MKQLYSVSSRSLGQKRNKKGRKLTFMHGIRQLLTQTRLTIQDSVMHHMQQILIILVLEIALNRHDGALDFLDVAERGVAAVVGWFYVANDFVVTLVEFGVDFFQEVDDVVHFVVDDLDSVVEVGELVFLRTDVGGQDVGEHVGDVADGGFFLLLWFMALLLLSLVDWWLFVVAFAGVFSAY